MSLTSTTQDKRERLAALLQGQRCVRAASLFDPMSARIADDIGFELGLMGGSVVSFAVLGDPDITLITLSELAEQTRRVCRAGELAVLVDGDHGYGQAFNVARTIAELEMAGASGVCIEDTVLPAPLHGDGAAALVSVEEGVAKMRAAVHARGRSGLAVMARTSAASLLGLDEAIVRLRAYAATGVDALFLPYLQSRAQLQAIAAAVDLPLVLAAGDASLDDATFLAQHRVSVWHGGHQPFAAAVQASYEAMRALHAGVPAAQIPGLASKALMARLTREAHFETLRRDWHR